MTLLHGQRAELHFLKQQIQVLDEAITTQSLKTFIVCALELYLSFALVLSLFECRDEWLRDEQELQYMTRMAWIPMVWGVILAVGHKLLPSVAPAPENLDRNLRNSKLVTWILSLLLLIWDEDMEIKKGPALQVAIMFSVCDLARYEMEVANLIEDDEQDEDVRTDQELESLAHAVSVASHANDQEQAFKNQLQAVANHSDDDDDDDDDHDGRGGRDDVDEDTTITHANAALHYATMASIDDDNAYQEYYGATPSTQTSAESDGRRHVL